MLELDKLIDQIERGKTSASKIEGSSLDFKTDSPTPKESFKNISEAAVCFANSQGGTVVVGVADTGTGHEAIRGTDLKAQALRVAIHEQTSPNLLVDVQETTYAGKRLLLVQVPEGIGQVFATTKGTSLWRLHDRCVPMSPDQVARLSEERSGRDWSINSTDLTVEDTDSRAVEYMYRLLSAGSRDASKNLARLSLPELLRDLSLIQADGHLTEAGAALLCGPDKRFNGDALVYQHRATPSGEADFVGRWPRPVLTAFVECLETVRIRVNSQPVTTNRGQQILIEDVPLPASREALINGLVHGDWREGRPVQIEHSPALFTVTSPGPLVSGITPANILTNGSRPRFPSLARAATAMDLAEHLGQGVDRMFREMVSSGRDVPTVTVENEYPAQTTVTFKGGPPNVRLAKFVAELPEAERRDTDALLVTHLLCARKSVTAKDVAPVIQRDTDQTEDVLRRLTHGEAQILEPTPGTASRRHPNYRFRGTVLASLGNAVAYSRRSASETDRKVVEHIKEYSTINSGAIQRMFDLDVYQARDLLRDLVERQILIRVSEQSRGVAVKYGSGQAFPVTRTRRTKRKLQSGPEETLF